MEKKQRGESDWTFIVLMVTIIVGILGGGVFAQYQSNQLKMKCLESAAGKPELVAMCLK